VPTYRLFFYLLLALALSMGCSSNQTVKNTWKGTKNIWYSYVNVPAAIAYSDTGSMPEYETLFSKSIMGIDLQLLALERTMQNADKPPTPEWLNTFFAQFPWVDGVTGLDGTGAVVGEVERNKKQLDFSPLLENDPKQNLHALRGYVQESDDGPAVLLAVPLYDGPDFLGVVVAYFEMRSLMRYSDAPENLIITSPGGLLWSGSSVGTLPNADWGTILRKSASGTISDASGSYQWVSRYLGNYPLVFATQKTASGKTSKNVTAEPAPREEKPSADASAPSAASDTAPSASGPDNLDLALPPLSKL
jgi:hypothetical protein